MLVFHHPLFLLAFEDLKKTTIAYTVVFIYLFIAKL